MSHLDHDHPHEHARGEARRIDRATAGAARIVYLDCFSGIAGDMTLAALVDAGVPLDHVREELGSLGVTGWQIATRTIVRSGIAATKLDVEVGAGQPERTFSEIRSIIEGSKLADGARSRALQVFERLGRAEARVHRVELDDVHFHEVGAVDAIVDVCGTAVALDWLGARVTSAPVPHGRGFVEARHGVLPLPSPAALEALEGVPVYGVDLEAELVTPTGAAIVGALAESFGPLPSLRIESIGWGAGTRELPDRPNLLRAIVGEPALSSSQGTHFVIEANVDDMTPEIAGFLLERLLCEGALDVWLGPVQMKKGRPGFLVGVLARAVDRERLETVLLSESTTIGVRRHAVERRELPRSFETVETRYGPIPIKVASDGVAHNAVPEFEACKSAALAYRVPLKDVFAEAIAAYHRR
ncbi:MAG: nickel pincer cofactor biosynthesis protein LarC [Deltaproteobacteria bacterium]|nr:nickel pincer cofactor biosynthesis protein LarC [Deltaproteobacteria bacterium]